MFKIVLVDEWMAFVRTEGSAAADYAGDPDHLIDVLM
jgi:hypothetical protein